MSDNKKDDGWLSLLKDIAVNELLFAILDFIDAAIRTFWRIVVIILGILAFLAFVSHYFGTFSLFK